MLFLSKAEWARGQTVRQRQGRQPVFAVVPRWLLPTSMKLGRNQVLQEMHLPALRRVWCCPQTVSAIEPCAPPICTWTANCARKLNFYCVTVYAITLFGRLRRNSTIIRVALFYLKNCSIESSDFRVEGRVPITVPSVVSFCRRRFLIVILINKSKLDQRYTSIA